MHCGTCGAENRADRRFCGQCGNPLAVTCPACGTANEPGDRFCGNCGSALGESPAPQAHPPAAGAERRLVSVLFADLVGFTTLSEHRDPEEVRELLSRYFDRCRVLIERYGGVVEKFIGDAVMAVWGTPVAREDDAERAVRAALALTQAVTALGAEVGMPDLRVRAGVLTGSAAVDLAAEGEAMVLGDTVNTASRLQSIAAPGTVLVDDVTRRSSEAAVVYEDTGTHQLKGRDAPVRAWTALRVVAGVGGARRSSGLEAPFVGRDTALEQIVAASEATAAERTARRTIVVGEAGSGKSRLLWEFFKHVDGLEANFWWHQGRALSYGEGVGYWALAEMVRARAGIAEEEEPAAARAKLAAVVERYVTDERERRLVEPRLAHLLGLEQRVAPDRADLFSGWRLFFERLAATGPVLLAFEDLHWADGSLLDFVDYLLEWSAEYPIFVLALARPELAAVRPGWRPDVVLEPLGDADMRALLDALVPGLPSELAERILAQAEGVPLYAVETVRMLLDRELLAQDGARYVVTGDVGALDVPETLHALVAARLDGFTADERAVLQLASVCGQAFSPAAVAALADRPAGHVRQTLDGLVAKQVLGYDDDPRAPEPGQYRFLQGLLRTIAYGTLSRRDRRAHHLAAARHLRETAEAGEVADVLASHFLEAARAEPDAPDAAEIRASARVTLAEAGERARSLALGAEAQRAFDQAAGLAEDDATRADLLDRAGRAAWLEADAGAARERLDAAVRLYDAAGETAAAARVKLALSDIMWQTGELEAAVDLVGRAYEGLPRDDADRAAAAALLGRLRLMAFDPDAALGWAEDALDVAEGLQRWDVIADAIITRAAALGYKGRPEEAEALVKRGTDIALEHDDQLVAWRGLNNASWLVYLQDRLDESDAYASRALEVARARGDRVRMRESEMSAAAAAADRGDWDGLEAVSWTVDPTLEMSTGSDVIAPLAVIRAARGQTEALAELCAAARAGLDMDDRQARDSCIVAVAVGEAAAGAADAALARLAPLLPETTALRPAALVIYLETAHDQGRDDLVREAVAAVRALPPAAATPTVRAYADRFSALLAEDPDEAEALLTRAAELLAGVGRTFERAKVLLEHAERFGDRARLDEAREMFLALDAQPWLERCDSALADAART